MTTPQAQYFTAADHAINVARRVQKLFRAQFPLSFQMRDGTTTYAWDPAQGAFLVGTPVGDLTVDVLSIGRMARPWDVEWLPDLLKHVPDLIAEGERRRGELTAALRSEAEELEMWLLVEKWVPPESEDDDPNTIHPNAGDSDDT